MAEPQSVFEKDHPAEIFDANQGTFIIQITTASNDFSKQVFEMQIQKPFMEAHLLNTDAPQPSPYRA